MYLNLNTRELLDAIGAKNIFCYLFDTYIFNKEKSKRICAKYEIDDKTELDQNIEIDLDDHRIWDNDILDEFNEDDLYHYLEDRGYDFPQYEESIEYVPCWGQEPKGWDNYQVVETLKEVFNRRFGKTYTQEELKKQVCDAIDWYCLDAKKE